MVAKPQVEDLQSKIARAPRLVIPDGNQIMADHYRRMENPEYAAAWNERKRRDALTREDRILREAERIRAWRKDFGRLPVYPSAGIFL